MTARTALVSGANRGIGAAIARNLREDGWNLSLGMRRAEEPSWARGDDGVHVARYDATTGSEQQWVDAALQRFGRIDAVVANAGLMIPKSVVEADDADLDAMIDVNVKAPRRLAKAAWPSLIASGSGRVVVIASLSGKRVASAMTSLYSMTKFAAVALAHGIRHEGWEAGVRATAVCPGLVATDMGTSLGLAEPDTMTRPEDVARLVSLALDLPNSASVAEMSVNCRDGETY